MINAQIAPPLLLASPIIDTYELTYGDPLILDYGGDLEFSFPAATEVSVRKSRNMSMTPVSGRDGTIKQNAGQGDAFIEISCSLIAYVYSATIKNPLARDGFDFDVSSVFQSIKLDPLLDQIRKLYRLLYAERMIPVINERLNKLGISYLVVQTVNLPDLESYWDQPISLSAIEDSVYDIVDLRGQDQEAVDTTEIDAEADSV